MRVVELNVYNVRELCPKSFKRAYNDFIEDYEYPFTDDVDETIEAIKRAFDVELQYDRSYNLDKCSEWLTDDILKLTGTRLYAYVANNYLPYIVRPKYYSCKYTSKVIFVEDCCGLTGVCTDCWFLDTFSEWLKKPDLSMTYADLLEKATDEFWECYQKDYDYAFSEENFQEIAEMNEFEFLEGGNRY